MANRIKYVNITKLWGIKNISTTFKDHVNIFIGSNGSSKTTFLNLIEATLRCHLKTLAEIDFECIEIILNEGERLYVFKIHQEDETRIRYSINHDISYEVLCEELSFRNINYFRQRETISKIQEELSRLVNISWLSINRENPDFSERDYRQDPEIIRNMVDFKLKDLVKRLSIYRLQLEQDANRSADKFKEECLSLMLYNESLDKDKLNNLKKWVDTDTTAMRRDLFQAFNVLGVVKNKKDQILAHISKIQEVISRISSSESVSLDDIFVISLIDRTLSIIEISKMHEAQKKEIFSPMDSFLKCLNGFMPDKSFELNKDDTGGVSIILKEGRDRPISIGITSLSSGEKQLFILLAEVLLQKRMPHIFIADEPELSLHIAWQRRIIQAILDLNPNAQIIVATHSPEVAADHRHNLVNMKFITKYE